MSARLSSAQVVCSSCSPPPQHFPTVPFLPLSLSLFHCLAYGRVLKGDRLRSPDTPHLVPTNTSAAAEKNSRARFSFEPITPFPPLPLFPPFLARRDAAMKAAVAATAATWRGPGGACGVNCIISPPPASLLTVRLEAGPPTQCATRHMVRPEAAVGAIR